jgi:hypothetical protein
MGKQSRLSTWPDVNVLKAIENLSHHQNFFYSIFFIGGEREGANTQRCSVGNVKPLFDHYTQTTQHGALIKMFHC